MRHQLWLLRHAKTEADPPPGGGDRDRRLAPRGRRDAEALGRSLAAAGAKKGPEALRSATVPGLVLCSAATRALETAEAVVARLDPRPAVERLESLYAASPREVIRQVAKVGEEVTSVMVVGHNPTAEILARELLAEGDRPGAKRLRRSLPTCALVVYDLQSAWADLELGSGRLAALLTPPY